MIFISFYIIFISSFASQVLLMLVALRNETFSVLGMLKHEFLIWLILYHFQFLFQAANPDEMKDHKLDLIGAKAWIRIAMRLGKKFEHL